MSQVSALSDQSAVQIARSRLINFKLPIGPLDLFNVEIKLLRPRHV